MSAVGENLFAGDADLLAMLAGDPGPAPDWANYETNGAGAQSRVEQVRRERSLRVETLRELRDRPPERVPIVAGRRVVRREILALVARGGLGKSTLTRAVVAHGAAGRPYCGFDFDEPVRSIYFSGEGSGALWQEAMFGVVAAFDFDDDVLERITVVEGGGPSGLKLNRVEDRDRARSILDERKVDAGLDVVVFDPFQRFAPGDENSSRDMGAATDALLDLATEFDVAMIVPHHSSQAGRGLDALRGHTIFEGAIATGLVLTAPSPGERVLEAVKVRYAASAADQRAIVLDFDEDARVYREQAALGSKSKFAPLLDAIADGGWHKANEVADDLGVARTTFREGLLAAALEAGLVDTMAGPKNATLVRQHDPVASLAVAA